MSKKLHIGNRLREERERLGLNQTDFAEKGNVKRKTQYNYETGERCPDADYLSALAAVGVDTNYILTGIRMTKPMNEPQAFYTLRPDQSALLDNYEHCSEEDKTAIKQMALRGAEAQAKEGEQQTEPKKQMNSD